MRDEDIVVIGAGPAALAAASLRRAGLPHLVIDRAHDVAASWKQHYDACTSSGDGDSGAALMDLTP